VSHDPQRQKDPDRTINVVVGIAFVIVIALFVYWIVQTWL
jgi:hypothetical protein